MILEARRRHRHVALVGVPLLLGLVAAAHFVRPVAITTDLSTLEPELAPRFRAVAVRTDLFGELPIEVRFSGSGRLQVSNDALLGPAVLLYFRENGAPAAGVESARLLGSMPTQGSRDFRMPEDWTGGGRLLLFSLGHMEILARSAELPTLPSPAPGGEP